ncbi:MAG TPA: DNA polymerase domain-containing protein, partial [Nitrospiria bacterium]
GILIPWRKSEPEGFKSGLELLTIDKGGLVFVPPAGFHDKVAELDFASMYPTIMVRYNLSPETVGCACCPHNRIPETGYSVCTRRRGLVPRTLAPILAKRVAYKERIRTSADPAQRELDDKRQTALKWLLVVSFGYLGYKNARFGRIEAHECVTACSREILLQAKEVAEDAGFRFLHAIVDSLWVKKAGAAERDYLELARQISIKTGLSISLEGIYRWISFPPSQSRPGLAVPNRYWGVFQSGKLKIRGLEVRRSDTPPFIREAQNRMMAVLGRAENRDDFRRKIPEAVRVLGEARMELSEGRVPLRALAISRRLSREPRDYRKAGLTAVVAQELLARGVRLRAGETIQYIITNAADRDPASRARAYAAMTADHAYDIEKYTDLLIKSGESLLSPFGFDAAALERLTRP